MGCYDSIIIPKMICPRCKQEIHDVEFQTKAGSCMFEVYHIGDYFPSDPEWLIEGLAECPACTKKTDSTFGVSYTWLHAYIDLDQNNRISKLTVWKYSHKIPDKNQPVFTSGNALKPKQISRAEVTINESQSINSKSQLPPQGSDLSGCVPNLKE